MLFFFLLILDIAEITTLNQPQSFRFTQNHFFLVCLRQRSGLDTGKSIRV